jgi:hypothetical protein
MRGVIFTEFMDLVEEKFGPEVLDEVLETSELEHGGAYTSVGDYDHKEILRMVGQLSRISGAAPGALVKAFGMFLLDRFSQTHARYFVGIRSSFEFLPLVETHIHRELEKLYPDAKTPTLRCERTGPEQMTVTYLSKRPFADLAEGMILSAANVFGERIQLEREDYSEGDMQGARFALTRLS